MSLSNPYCTDRCAVRLRLTPSALLCCCHSDWHTRWTVRCSLTYTQRSMTGHPSTLSHTDTVSPALLLPLSFHCDEALACWLLRQTATYQHSKIHRTRDTAILDTLPIIVDVGATYNPAAHRYDHHQRGFTETFSPEHPIKLSSAGLVYKHFGQSTHSHHSATHSLLRCCAAAV